MEHENKMVSTDYLPEELYTIECCAAQNGTYVAHIRGEFCPTVEDFYREISSAMRFPYYFGWNWAAFDECICDLEWLKSTSLLIVIDNQDKLFSHEKSVKENRSLLIKYLNIAIQYWTSEGVPISIYLNQSRKNRPRTWEELTKHLIKLRDSLMKK